MVLMSGSESSRFLVDCLYCIAVWNSTIVGVMISVLTSTVVDCGFESRAGQTNDYEIDMCCFSPWYTDGVGVNQQSLTHWLMRGRLWVPLTSYLPPHWCVCLKTRSGLMTWYVVTFFMFNDLMWEAIARFVDIGGIVDHHRFDFLSII
jgi:hypothetical protein